MYFLDAGTCVDFLQGRLPHALEMLKRSDPRIFGIPTVVETELRLDALRSARPEENAEKVSLFLSPFEKVPFDSACAEEYVRVSEELERSGASLGAEDLMVASTVLAHAGRLITDDVSTFRRVEGLEIESWSEGTRGKR